METIRIHYRGPLPRKNEKRQPGINPKTGKRYIYIKTEVEEIAEAIHLTAKVARNQAKIWEPYPGPLEVKIVWRFKNGSDVDRAEEVTLDALQNAAYVNDSQVKHLVQTVDESQKWAEDEAIIILRPFDGTTYEERLLEDIDKVRALAARLAQEKYSLNAALKKAGIPCLS